MHANDRIPLNADAAIVAACSALKIEPLQGMVTRGELERIGEWLSDRPHLFAASGQPAKLQGIPSAPFTF